MTKLSKILVLFFVRNLLLYLFVFQPSFKPLIILMTRYRSLSYVQSLLCHLFLGILIVETVT